jgi:transmembrane sensor
MLDHHHIILAKYFGGTATNEDLLALDEWLNESKVNDDYFIETSKLYGKIGNPSNVSPFPNKAKAKLALHDIIFQDELNSSLTSKKKATFKINRNQWIGIAASLIVLTCISLAFNSLFSKDRAYEYISKNQVKKEILPDQTCIELAENSQVTYKPNEKANNKYITLEGKAYFEISKKSSGQVLICADDVYIHDIGTAFTVDAYKTSNYVKVSVKSGMVDFYTAQNKGIKLSENEIGIYNKKTQSFSKQLAQSKKTTSTIENDSKWTEVINCEGMTLEKLVNQMNNRFQSKITLADQSIGDEQISVKFDGTESLDLMLQVISQTMELNIKKKGKEFILSKNK